ncbi:MAG: hypothetical protein RPU34_04430 [Candidatus Sedimenticola sp. (ex Thyasira tokunagai)]
MTEIHHYNAHTGEYAGSSIAQLDPLDEKPMVPANATTILPLQVAADEKAVFVNGGWVAQKDARGAEYWMPDGTYHQITRIGDVVPGNALNAPPPPALTDDELTVEAASQIDSICDKVYTTSVSRTARYERKFAEALRYRAAGYPHPVAETDYTYLVRESTYRTESKRDLADLIIARATAFNDIGSAAEAARAELPPAIAAAVSADAKQAAADAIVDRIRTLATNMEQ